MNGRFDGRRVLLTGGSRGIGRAIALAFAREGGTVMACYRSDKGAAEQLRIALKETGGRHHVVQADVARPDDVARLVADAGDRLGGLDAVVHNAGAISHVPFAELSLAEWRRVVDTNLTAAFLLAQHSLPLLSEGSSIVFVGSKVAAVGVPLRSHYTAAKAGLQGLTRSLCKELGPKGIRVNVVAPGVIETEEAATLPPDVYRRYQALSSLGRLGHVDEVATAVLFAADPAAGYLTGQTINVDGGA
jgi:3-oxoacyl-[acyl-carrier protein] reductase